LLGIAILVAFTMVLGLHVALRNEKSRLAILNTLATVFFLSIGTLICIYLILINGRFEYQWFSFISSWRRASAVCGGCCPATGLDGPDDCKLAVSAGGLLQCDEHPDWRSGDEGIE